MIRFYRKSPLLLFFLSCLLLFSCATRKKPTAEPAVAQARRYFAAGEFQKAIDSYGSLFKKHPRDKTLNDEYIKTLEAIKQQADRALDKKDFDSAEKRYAVLENNYPQFKPIEKSLSFTPQILGRQIKICRFGPSERRAQMALQAGDYQKALEVYRVALQDDPREARLSRGLRKIVEEIKSLADGALAKENYISAGKAYFILGKNYTFYEKLAPPPSFPREAVDEGIKNCRTRLTQKGLEQYRKGNLAEAISLWQGILVFDPDNTEIKKAIQTATAQLKKLKKQ